MWNRQSTFPIGIFAKPRRREPERSHGRRRGQAFPEKGDQEDSQEGPQEKEEVGSSGRYVLLPGDGKRRLSFCASVTDLTDIRRVRSSRLRIMLNEKQFRERASRELREIGNQVSDWLPTARSIGALEGEILDPSPESGRQRQRVSGIIPRGLRRRHDHAAAAAVGARGKPVASSRHRQLGRLS